MAYTGKLDELPLLDVIQIVAYSQQSGILTVKSSTSRGLIIFELGNVVCAYSPSALPLLVKAAKEIDAQARLSLRRIQILTAVRELFDIAEGSYRFVQKAEPVLELEGLSLKPFYQSGALDTGDLLLVLEKAMEELPTDMLPVRKPSVEETKLAEHREFPRFGPVAIPGALTSAEQRFEGYLTNVSLGGTFFHADALPPLDAAGTLDFELPWDLGACRAHIKVVWLRGDGLNMKRGAGLLFQSTGGGTRKKIEAYIKQFQKLVKNVERKSKDA